LKHSFANPRITKVLHAGDNDIRILCRDYGFTFHQVFDTQKAAALLGCRHLSLSAIVEEILGRNMEKTKKMQRSRWETRPLTEEQIRYAVQDTEHLLDLYRKLGDHLKRQGLERKALQSFQEIAAARWTGKTIDPSGHLRINGCRELNKSQKNRLKDLYRWRFRKAKETNMAIFMVLSDQNILDLARMKIPSLESLQKAVKLPPGRFRILGPEIFELLKG
jgi:ribonuclease D